MGTVMIDTRMKNKIEAKYHYENGSYSIKFKDLQDIFWFDNSYDLQIFLNEVARERYYDNKVKKGYFLYKNENNETFKYNVKSKNGTLNLENEEFVNLNV